jgi:TolB protein
MRAQTPGRILVTNEEGDYTLRPDGTRRIKLDATRAIGWTVDGCKIAYTRDSHEIVVDDAAGSNAKVVAQGAWANHETEDHPRYSPDGLRILFISESRPPAVTVVDVDGSHATQVTKGVYAFHPSWSPDGKQILFGSAGNPRHVRVVNADGSNLRDLGPGSGPQWAPDGSRIAFVVGDNRAGRFHSAVAVINADGTGLTSLTTGPRAALRPVWSPSGEQIAFESIANDGVHLEAMNTDGSHRVTIADQLLLNLGDDGVSTLAWSPDGSRIAYTRAAAQVTDRSAQPRFDVYVVGRTSSGKDAVVGWLPQCTKP